MAQIIDVPINASQSAPRVVEVDAAIVAQIIMRTAHARAKPAAKAANEIMDYLALCMRANAAIS